MYKKKLVKNITKSQIKGFARILFIRHKLNTYQQMRTLHIITLNISEKLLLVHRFKTSTLKSGHILCVLIGFRT